MSTRAGFVAIIGKPNAGKSTLMNSILGTKLSIVTPKPQTTRKNVLGIFTSDNVQIVFVDTPGILNPKYELQRSMMRNVEESVSGADVVALIIDTSMLSLEREIIEPAAVSLISSINKPKIALLNKIDLLKDVKLSLPMIDAFKNSGYFEEILPISALKGANVTEFISALYNYLPESDFLYDAEMLSTQPERFFVAEIIREVLFTDLKQELPYSTEVIINEFKERDVRKWLISADIVVERDTQKVIIVGAKGTKIKSIGEKARKAIELHLGRDIFLELFVKVRSKWRNNKSILKSMGY